MKKLIFFTVLAGLITIQYNLQAQSITYRHNNKLSLINDSIVFCASNSFIGKYALGNTTEIIGSESNVEKGAIIGGIAGMVTGILVGGIAYYDDSFLDIIGDALSGEDVSGSINPQQVPFIVGGTLAGAAIGALIGLIGRKTAMYERKFKVDLQPNLALAPGQCEGMIFSVKLNFR